MDVAFRGISNIGAYSAELRGRSYKKTSRILFNIDDIGFPHKSYVEEYFSTAKNKQADVLQIDTFEHEDPSLNQVLINGSAVVKTYDNLPFFNFIRNETDKIATAKEFNIDRKYYNENKFMENSTHLTKDEDGVYKELDSEFVHNPDTIRDVADEVVYIVDTIVEKIQSIFN